MKRDRKFWCLVVLLVVLGAVLMVRVGIPVLEQVSAREAGRSVNDVLKELDPKMKESWLDLDWITDGEPIVLVALKEEQVLELWKERGDAWEKVTSYPFTAYSGELGPKLKQGDRQIPEGIYKIEYLNPNSSYHLSMKVTYPNAFDRKQAKADGRSQLGGDIFIHGSAVTIGCIPIGDEKIEELFYLIAKNGYQNTKVIILPVDFREGKAVPQIKSVEWEKELYEMLAKEVTPLREKEK